ncbi:hypothetical protein ACLB2K_035968 [Fragaria x ananassa]
MPPVPQSQIQSSSNQQSDLDFHNDFPPKQIVDYNDVQRHQEICPSPSPKKLALCEPETQPLENMQKQLENIVYDVVRKEVDNLVKQADEEKTRQQQPEHDSGKTSMESTTITTKQDQRCSKTMAYIPNISFRIPESFKIDNDKVNEFVPMDDILRQITAQTNKKYSLFDRLHGWNMEGRMRLDGQEQFDKNPADEEGLYVELWLCVAWSNPAERHYSCGATI